MKRNFFVILTALSLVSFSFTACTKDKNQNPQPGSQPELKKEAQFLSDLEKKLKTPSIAGSKAELITPEEYDSLLQMDLSHGPADLKKKHQDVVAQIQTEVSRIKKLVDEKPVKPTLKAHRQTYPSCVRNKIWKKIIQDPDNKLWLWQDTSKFGGLDVSSVRPTVDPTGVCTNAELDNFLVGENREVKKVPDHFKTVVIQGAGPAGLLLGLELYTAGSTIHIIEKRAGYTRAQILRLDPKWRASLQFYLGEDYHKLLSEGKMRINPNDETVEIPTHEMEKALARRARALYVADAVHFIPHMNLMVDGIIKAKTVQISNMDSSDPREIIADQLFLAGGSNNPLMKKLLFNKVINTQKKWFSVASFEKPFQVGDPPESKKCLKSTSFIGALTPEEVQEALVSICKKHPYSKNPACKAVAADKGVSTRQFETAHVAYFGIEAPTALKQLAEECEQHFSTDSDHQKTCLKNLANDWARAAVAKIMDSGSDPTKPCFHPIPIEGSAGVFMVYQESTQEPTTVEKDEIIVTPVGDSLVSPHYFSGSGLTGARKTIEAIRRLSKVQDKTEYIRLLEEDHKSTIQYVLEKGRPYFN